jgi:fibronectin type 3 domain-containing protein
VSEDPPEAPGRPEVTPLKGSVRLKWETQIGANDYKVYRREKGKQNWAAIYSGRSQGFVDKNAKSARAKFSKPGYKTGASSDMTDIVIYEYCVTASDKNGESPKSEITNTDPRNW